MTVFGEKVFSDVVKDVIGNDPVLDQFDISYAASFYGTMQDDYVTGTMLSEISRTYLPSFKAFIQGLAGSSLRPIQRFLLTGTRGRYASKYYPHLATPLGFQFGTGSVSPAPYAAAPDALKVSPYLSFRLSKLHERMGRSYRFSQFYDSSERYYDTCLPDFGKCLEANGAALWLLRPDNDFWLSPYANVKTKRKAFITFNWPYTVDRTSQGFDSDPLIDNKWTWSYPYENRYEPTTRLIKPSKTLGNDLVKLSTAFGFGKLSLLPHPEAVDGIFPLLSGKLSKGRRFSGGRNSGRIRLYITGTSYMTQPALATDERQDEAYGFSWLFPNDVYLNQVEDHDFIDYFNSIGWAAAEKPKPAPLTGTMNYNDTVKFIFGFGDLNNMGYSSRTLDLTGFSTKTESFEAIANGTAASSIPDVVVSNEDGLTGDVVRVSFVNSPSIGANQGWRVLANTNTTTISGITYNGIGASTTTGIWWFASVGGTKVLVSDTNGLPITVPFTGNMVDTTLPYDASIVALDITSSVPWSFRYQRAVSAHISDGLLTYFSAAPGLPALPGYGVLSPIEYLSGSTTSGGGSSFGFMSQFDLASEGSKDKFPSPILTILAALGLTPENDSFVPYENPLTPGEYRLCFAYLKSGSIIANPDFAAIDNLQIKYWLPRSSVFDVTGSKIGGNNYPEFRRTIGDDRFLPIPVGSNTWPANQPSVVSGTAGTYTAYNFGISPVIRGWKYGLYSGLPQNSKAVFRRDRYGQFRDMLEQRQFSKFVEVENSPVDNEAITFNGETKQIGDTIANVGRFQGVGPAPVSVVFVKQRYTRDERGIGDIYNEKVHPSLTYSQNLSYEATSSLPYFDGVPRHRTEDDIKNVKDLTVTSLGITTTGITVS